MKLFDETRPASVEDVAWLRKQIRRELRNLRIQPDLVDDLQLAIAELATNAVVHASQAPENIAIRIDLVGASLRIEIRDDGAPFVDFAERWAHAQRKNTVADGVSGLGLALANAALRSVSYIPGSSGEPNRMIGWRPLQRQRPTILIIEDDTTLLQLYSALLKDSYRVLTATSVQTALALAQGATVDLILSDYHLGAEVGTDVLSALQRDAHRLPVPVIMLSSDRTVATSGSADGYGIEMFLYKPVSPKELRTAIEQVMVRSARRLAGLFRYFAANVEGLFSQPDAEELQALGIAHRTAAATAGGGDFILHMRDGGTDRLVLVDVMGHGLKAKAGAIAFASIVRTINAMLQGRGGPGGFLRQLSNALRNDPALAQIFATLVVVDRLDPETLAISSSAHPAPVVIGEGGVRVIDVNGPLLGLVGDVDYPETQIVLGARERLLLVTDGVEPRFLAGGGSLPDRLLDCLTSHRASPLAEAADAAAAWISAEHGPSLRDDWTLMLLEARTFAA